MAPLRHLIVDEYQDVNPAQERAYRAARASAGPSVRRRRRRPVDLPVARRRRRNIVEFADRYPSVGSFTIDDNRRSRPEIIAAANRFAPRSRTGSRRRWSPTARPPERRGRRAGRPTTEADEAELIADAVAALTTRATGYRDIAILCARRASLPADPRRARARRHSRPAGRTHQSLPPARGRSFRADRCLACRHDWREAVRPRYERSRSTPGRRLRGRVRARRGRAGAVRGSWRLEGEVGRRRRDRANLVARLLRAPRRARRRRLGPRRSARRRTGSGRWPAARSSSPTTRRRAGAARPTTRTPASRSAARTAASGTTSGSRSTSRTGRAAPTRTSKARTTSSSTPST